ncbi:Putative HTH-type transcriptional regulator [Streptomonospora litoralis]|uniref:HTH-type transcriptional regulator n=2 Tax=Streptomonospora litoralis TaxID=2498135 RepID=A0A4P6Q1W7_9ACTN|nr:Putative HTH-type transcriptional regulator [Streptomonospora litoralis]
MLTDVLDGARSGQGSAVLFSGGPGMGKTALLDHACEAARTPQVGHFRPPQKAMVVKGAMVLGSSGTETESAMAFAGLQRLLRPVLDRVAELPDQQAAALDLALESGRVAESDRFPLSIGVLRLLCLLGHSAPLLVCVDDAHLMDAASLDALAFAARRLGTDPVAMVFAARDDSPKPVVPGIPAVALEPLGDPALSEVLGDAAPGGIAAGVRAELVRCAHGNPAAARGFAAALSRDQLSGARPLPRALPLPAHLLRAYTPRLEALPEPARHLLLLAATDPECGLDLLVRAADRPEMTVGDLEPAENAGLVRVDGAQAVFTDPVLCTAVYQAAPVVARRAAHARLARVLDPERDPSRYARHRAAAAEGPDSELAAELAAAADTAKELNGHAVASAALEQAAELTPIPRLRACRLSTAAQDAWLSGMPERAAGLLDRAGPDAVSPRQAGVLELIRGQIRLREGNAIDTADALLDTAERLLPHDRELAVRSLMRAADAASFAGDPVRHAAAARRLAPLARDNDPPAMRLAFAFMEGCALSFAGEYAGAVGPLRRATDLAEEVDTPAELIWAGIAGLRLGDAPLVHALSTRAVAVARRRGALAVVPQALEFLVYSEFWSGRFPSGIGNCMTGLRLARETSQPNCATHHLAALSLLAAIQGDSETCHERARAVAERSCENSLGLPIALSSWALALLDLAQGDAHGAFSRLRVLNHAGPGYGHPTMRLLTAPVFVEACVRTGEYERAEVALAPYEAWSEATGSLSSLAVAARCRGLLAGAEDAAEHFEEALRLHRACGDDDVERARTALLYGTTLRRNRFPGRAREHLREALETFEWIGARLWVEQARGELRAIGDPEPAATAERGDHGLTTQQHQIALLVAEGATNREVAAHMFISPRTVEHHLRGIFRKLNIRSRVDLARMFR